LSLYTSFDKFKELVTDPTEKFRNVKSLLEGLSIALMIQGLKESGEGLYYGLYGPSYSKAVEDMLESADQLFFFNFDPGVYQRYIKHYLIHPPPDALPPLMVPRKSDAVKRSTVEVSEGMIGVYSSVIKKLNNLIADINKSDLPDNFSIDSAITQLKELKRRIIQSCTWFQEDVSIEYDTYLKDENGYVPKHIFMKLGEPAQLQRVFSECAGRTANKDELEMWATLTKLLDTPVLVINYAFPDSGFEAWQTIISSASIAEEVYSTVFYTNAEE
jgi:hypothetical protein